MLQFETSVLIANVGLFWILEETNLGLGLEDTTSCNPQRAFCN